MSAVLVLCTDPTELANDLIHLPDYVPLREGSVFQLRMDHTIENDCFHAGCPLGRSFYYT